MATVSELRQIAPKLIKLNPDSIQLAQQILVSANNPVEYYWSFEASELETTKIVQTDGGKVKSKITKMDPKTIAVQWLVMRETLNWILPEDHKCQIGLPEMPAYYQMNFGDLSDETEDYRCYSDDWGMYLYRHEDLMIYDFFGWPGDNQDGVGILVDWNQKVGWVIFTNNDHILVETDPRLKDAVRVYNEYRHKMLDEN